MVKSQQCVMTARQHKGDENGNTRYQYGSIRGLYKPGLYNQVYPLGNL